MTLSAGLLFFALAMSAVGEAEPLGPEGQALVAPVYAAYQTLEREQLDLPPPQNHAERLIRMARMDAVGRDVKEKIDVSALSPAQRDAAFAAINAEINRHDLVLQATLVKMMPPNGWFLKSQIGPEAAQAAFLIVQHAVNDVGLPEYDWDLQHKVLALMEPLLAKDEVDRQSYAMLYDRVQMFDGKPQLYGTQMVCRAGRWVLSQQMDIENVDSRRKAMGFALTLEQNMARFANAPPCGNPRP